MNDQITNEACSVANQNLSQILPFHYFCPNCEIIPLHVTTNSLWESNSRRMRNDCSIGKTGLFTLYCTYKSPLLYHLLMVEGTGSRKVGYHGTQQMLHLGNKASPRNTNNGSLLHLLYILLVLAGNLQSNRLTVVRHIKEYIRQQLWIVDAFVPLEILLV